MADEFNLTENEITPRGKFWGGFLFILFTVTAIVLLFAFWPDKIPSENSNTASLYSYKLFKIRLLSDTVCKDSVYTVKIPLANTAQHTTAAAQKDSTDTTKPNTTPSSVKLDNYKTEKRDTVICRHVQCRDIITSNTIELNTIFLILVAIMGFLGNMVHIATSFTTFVGNNNFKKSWTLWYIVKPFTASALAIILYFVLRAGFLSYSADAKNISLYGILALSALAGLFTDIATLKLKEVFETLFRPKDNRDDKLTLFKIDGVTPVELQEGLNNLSIKGSGFNTKKLLVKIDSVEVPVKNISETSIDFTYAITANPTKPANVSLSVFDEHNVEIFKKTLVVK